MWTSAVGLRWSVVVLLGRTHSRPRTYRKCRIVRALKRKFHIRENHKCIMHATLSRRRSACSCPRDTRRKSLRATATLLIRMRRVRGKEHSELRKPISQSIEMNAISLSGSQSRTAISLERGLFGWNLESYNNCSLRVVSIKMMNMLLCEMIYQIEIVKS